jgi:putative oxygen-independent coproporphyrinogen III oxidase
MLQPPLSLYVHFPWCVQKCPYCDFNSHKAGNNPPRASYIDALAADLRIEGERSGGRPVSTIFLGGGTPSFFSPNEIAQVLDSARRYLTISADCEVTMEANPGTLERGSLSDYRAAGVTRLSLGAQSFDAGMLKALGRIHGPGDIRSAYDDARKAGFESINVDLMFALPGQDLSMAVSDVTSLLELAPPHISYYQLTLEPNTVFHQRPPRDIPDDDLAWEIQERCHDLLGSAGYQKYEISAFAQPGHQCQHNLNYWNFGDYLAAGAGAHGKVTDVAGVAWRYCKPANPQSYIEGGGGGQGQGAAARINSKDLGFEFMLNALRLSDGFSEESLRDRTGAETEAVLATVSEAAKDGLMEASGSGRWRPTATGFRFLNDLQARFLP